MYVHIMFWNEGLIEGNPFFFLRLLAVDTNALNTCCNCSPTSHAQAPECTYEFKRISLSSLFSICACMNVFPPTSTLRSHSFICSTVGPSSDGCGLCIFSSSVFSVLLLTYSWSPIFFSALSGCADVQPSFKHSKERFVVRVDNIRTAPSSVIVSGSLLPHSSVFKMQFVWRAVAMWAIPVSLILLRQMFSFCSDLLTVRALASDSAPVSDMPLFDTFNLLKVVFFWRALAM